MYTMQEILNRVLVDDCPNPVLRVTIAEENSLHAIVMEKNGESYLEICETC
jgi:hypothetical protein